jgi:VanZ like protein/concanavalin A-like lectin/glucanase superfamily protein
MVHKDAVVNERLLGILCIAVLGVILCLGLWPLYVPANDVTWLANRNGLRLGRYSTVFSTDTFQAERGPGTGSLEIWLQPARVWVISTFLAFRGIDGGEPFRMRQYLTDLELWTGGTVKLYLDEIFRQPKPRFITVTSGAAGTVVYIDGVAAKAAPGFRLPATDFTGRLILGDAPGQADSWAGTLSGAAVYQKELAAQEVLKHYQTWTQQGRPEIDASERCRALYLFDERAGTVVHSRVEPGVDLQIPARYMVVDQMFLEPFWEEFSWSRSYASAALKNIVGFIPAGFVFFAYLSGVRGMRRAALVTVLLGTLISLTIEVLQGFLPTRDSGTTDLFTNTLGTWLGVWLYLRLHRWAATAFPWLPLFPTPRR